MTTETIENGAPAPGARPRSTLPPAIPELALGGLGAALVMGLTDVGYAAANRSGQLVSPLDMVVAGVFLVAMYLVPGLVAGAALGALVAIVRRTPWLDGARHALASPRGWLTPRPETFATTLAGLVVTGGLVVAIAEAHLHFSTRYHRADLAAYALAAAVLGLAAAAVLVTAALAIPLRALARRIGRVASLATLIGVVVIAAIVAPVVFLSLRPEIVDAYGVPAIAFVPAALLALVSLTLPIRGRLRRTSSVRAWLALGLGALVSAVALLGTALAYGDSNQVRSVIEERSIAGQRLVRSYQRRFDRDGDGHAWGFGGEDCDDSRADVYPGARDPEGDGVDADCFAGDGSPVVAEAGDGRYGTPPPGLARPNFLVVTIDALRPDHLSGNGYARPTSPNLDRFMQESVVFERTYAPSSRSIRSIPALWSGLYPSQIAYGGEYLYPSLLDENVMVPEVLGRRGYRRSVVMGTDYFVRCADFFQGWEDVDQIMIYKPPRPRPVDDGLVRLRELAGQGAPWMLWVHLFNVHGPWLQDGAPSDYGTELVDLYDTEVRLADEQVQRLLDALRELGLDQRTVVVIASDHGEQFYEHGDVGHSTTVYEEEVRATLMMRVPGVAPRRVPESVSLIDVAPTILNLAGAPMPRPTPSRSLVPQMQGEPGDPTRLIFGELVPDGFFPYDQRYVVDGDLKLIWWRRDGRSQLFDLSRDPGEHDDLSSERREDAERLRGLLRAWVAQAARPEMRDEEFVASHRLRAPPEGISDPLDVTYPGLFTLLGFDLPRRSFAVGEVIPLDLYFRVDSETDLDLYFRVDITGPPGYRVTPHFHGNHYPMHSRYHTDQWREGEILRDPVPIVIPPEAGAPVTLTLTLTIWSPEQNNRLVEGIDAGRPTGSIRLGEIEIRPGARAER